MLLELADASRCAAHLRAYPSATDYGRACASAAADAAREELLAVLDVPDGAKERAA